MPTLALRGLWPGIHSGLGQVPPNHTLPTTNNPRTLALHQHELLAQNFQDVVQLATLKSWRATGLATTATAVRTPTAEQNLLRENKS